MTYARIFRSIPPTREFDLCGARANRESGATRETWPRRISAPGISFHTLRRVTVTCCHCCWPKEARHKRYWQYSLCALLRTVRKYDVANTQKYLSACCQEKGTKMLLELHHLYTCWRFMWKSILTAFSDASLVTVLIHERFLLRTQSYCLYHYALLIY
jgi:hypothetical protein